MPFKSTKANVKQQVTAKPKVNYNKRYLECKLEVGSSMKPDGNGGEKLRHYTGEILKTIKTVSIEPKRASQLNRSWDSRCIFYWPEDEVQPKQLRRVAIVDEDGNPMWRNEKQMVGVEEFEEFEI